MKETETKSYKKIIQAHVMGLGVCKEEQMDYYREVHRIMAHAGIIDPQTIMEERKKPFKNSPWGEFVNYEYRNGKRVHVDSYMLNERGITKVHEILTKYVTDRYLTKGKLESAEPYLKEIRNSVDDKLLVAWGKCHGVEFIPADRNGNPHALMFHWNGLKRTYYYNANLVVDDTSKDNPFWFILHQETDPLPSKQDVARVSMEILSAHWNIKFGNGFVTPDKEETKKPKVTKTAEATTSPDLLNKLLEEISSLRAEVEELRQGKMLCDKKASQMLCDNKADTSTMMNAKSTKEDILSKIKALAKPQKAQKRYSTISQEQITKERQKARREALQKAYEVLSERRLLTAVNRPKGGWKFNFDNQSIELLYRVDSRQSAVYNAKHRPLFPKNGIKELANKGEKYNLPYGLEKIDYSYKTIFVTEGAYDSCFVKNCLAQNNWILPHEMSKVIDIFRDAGFQIIHIPNNFRLGDKGGLKFYEHIITMRDWLSKGDKMFSWEIYSDCDDLNDVAMKHELDEIPAQIIIDHSWNEEEARANYKNFMPTVDNKQPPVTDPREQKEEIITTAQNLTDELLQSDEYGLDLKSTVTVIEEEEKPCKSPSPNHLSDKDYRDNPPAMKDLYDDLDEMVENDAHDKQLSYDDDFEQILDEIEQEQKKSAEQVRERERMKKRYEEHLEEEMWEMERTTQAIYNPQSYLWKTPGITISPSKL